MADGRADGKTETSKRTGGQAHKQTDGLKDACISDSKNSTDTAERINAEVVFVTQAGSLVTKQVNWRSLCRAK